MIPDFWGQKDKSGVPLTGNRVPRALKQLASGETGIAPVNLNDFERQYLKMAEEPEEYPLAAVLPTRAHVFKEKFPQIPESRYWNVDFPAHDPVTNQKVLKLGLIFQFGEDTIDLVRGRTDLNLQKDGTIEIVLEWDERWAPEKLWKDDFAKDVKPVLRQQALDMLKDLPGYKA